MLPVVEQFVSINGEGQHAGELAYFIRFRGCNLSCSYCDTMWANTAEAPAVMYTVEELTEKVCQSGIQRVTLTGGEPLLQSELPALVEALMKAGHAVEIETNGSLSIKALAQSPYRPSFTLDYKLPDSEMERKMDLANYQWLSLADTVKLVVGSEKDLQVAEKLIKKERLLERCKVYLSPVFDRIEPSAIVDYMKEHQLNGVRLQLQLHKFIWPHVERGV